MNPGYAALLLASLLGWVDPAIVDDEVHDVLEDDRYAFCDPDADFVPLGGERDFCELLDTETDVCPGYVEHCLRKVESDPLEDLPDGTFAGSDETRDETTLNPGQFREGREPEPPPEPVEIPAGLARLAQVVLWILLALGLGWVIWTIIKNRAETAPREGETPDDTPPPDADPQIAAAAAAAKIVETDVERLLRLAQEAANRGDYRTAVDASHAALLRRLDGAGLIEITIDKTNGDYLRQVGTQNAQLRQELRPIVREVERVQFGTGEPDRSMFQRVFDRVVPVVRRTVLVFAVGIGLGAVTTGCDDDGGENITDEVKRKALDKEHAELGGLSTDPLGSRAVVQLLRRHELDVKHRTRTVEQLATTSGTIMVLGEVDLLDDEWDALIDWAERGNHLVLAFDGVLPERIGLEAYYEPAAAEEQPRFYYDEWGEEYQDDPLPIGTLQIDPGLDYEFYSPLTLRLPVWQRLRTIGNARIYDDGTYYGASELDEPWTWQPLLRGGNVPYALYAQRGDGKVTVFADSLMFTNAGLAVDQNATFVVDLVDGIGSDDEDWRDDIEIVDSWTGTGAQSPMDAIRNSHLTPLLLQLLAALILFYWWKGAAFGTLRDPPSASRRSFAEHVEALGLQYAKARASKHALSLYAGFAIERLRERLRPGTGGIYALAQAAAARTGESEASLMELLVEMHELRDRKSSIDDPREHLNLMRKIHKLLVRTGGPR